jgi:hypothetical protein
LIGLANKILEEAKKIVVRNSDKTLSYAPPQIIVEMIASGELSKKSDVEERQVAIKVINKTRMMM